MTAACNIPRPLPHKRDTISEERFEISDKINNKKKVSLMEKEADISATSAAYYWNEMTLR